MNNIKSFFFIGLIGMTSAIGFSLPSLAENSKKKANPKAKPAAKGAKQKAKPTVTKAKTVGQVVGDLSSLNSPVPTKSRASLPAFSRNLFTEPTQQSRIDLERVKPPAGNLFYRESGDKAELERITNQQIQELYKLTQNFKNSPRRGELWLRLAELYVEKASLIQMRQQEKYDQQLKDFFEKKISKKPKLVLNAALEYNRKAIQLYEWFVRDFGRDPKMDQALFFLGYNHFELNNTKKGFEFYDRLVKQYPRSSYITESYFALAEYYFENEKWDKAHEAYGKVLLNRSHRMFNFSQYKMAWASYRSGKSSRALKEMESVLETSRQGSATAKIEPEALRDLVLIYADAGSPDRAIGYFRQMAGDKADLSIERLAYLLTDRGQGASARKLFTFLIERNPSAEKAFDFQYQIVKSLSTSTNTAEFRSQFLAWIRDFSTGSRWYEANQANARVIENASRLRESTLRTWILQQHQAAQKTGARSAQLLAAEGYQLFISQFQQSPGLADMHFYYGEILYDLGRFNEAALQYRWVVENAPTSKFGVKAAENVVVAIQKTLPSEAQISKKVGKTVEPVPLGPESLAFVQVAEWFQQKFPNHPKALEIKFRTARLYYQHNQFEASIPLFRDIIKKDPKAKISEFSANLLLDIFNLKKDYAGLEKVGEELLQIPSMQNSASGNQIRGIILRAGFKRIQDQEKSSDPKNLASQYEKFGRSQLGTELGTTAFFNAAITYEKAGEVQLASEMHGMVLRSQDKKSEGLRKRSRRILAQIYKDGGRLESAAVAYAQSAAESGSASEAAALHFNAGLLFEAVAQPEKALSQYQANFEKARGDSKPDALWQIAELQRELGKNKQAISSYESYLGFPRVSAERRIESFYRIYELQRVLGNTVKSKAASRQALSLVKQLGGAKKAPGAVWAAKLSLQEAIEKEQELSGLEIPKDSKKQTRVVQDKIYLLNRLNTQLAEVIAYDSADEIVGALYLLAKANHQLAQDLIQAPIPSGLKPEEQVAYQDGVKQIASPFSQKAIETVKAGLDRASELEVYGEFYRNLRRLAHTLAVPDLAPHRSEVAVDTAFVHWMGL